MCLQTFFPLSSNLKEEKIVYRRFKVTKISDASGEIELFIDKTKSVEVNVSYVTLAAATSNVVRDVSIKRKDDTILGTEKAVYCTSQAIGLVFPTAYVIPSYDPVFKVDTATVLVGKAITFDCIYREVEVS